MGVAVGAYMGRRIRSLKFDMVAEPGGDDWWDLLRAPSPAWAPTSALFFIAAQLIWGWIYCAWSGYFSDDAPVTAFVHRTASELLAPES